MKRTSSGAARQRIERIRPSRGTLLPGPAHAGLRLPPPRQTKVPRDPDDPVRLRAGSGPEFVGGDEGTGPDLGDVPLDAVFGELRKESNGVPLQGLLVRTVPVRSGSLQKVQGGENELLAAPPRGGDRLGDGGGGHDPGVGGVGGRGGRGAP